MESSSSRMTSVAKKRPPQYSGFWLMIVVVASLLVLGMLTLLVWDSMILVDSSFNIMNFNVDKLPNLVGILSFLLVISCVMLAFAISTRKNKNDITATDYDSAVFDSSPAFDSAYAANAANAANAAM